ncbi:hypothetical protein [Pseudomonas sp. HLS-6 TE3448]
MEQRDSLAQEILFLPLLGVHQFGKLLKALRDKVQSALEHIKLLYFAGFALKKRSPNTDAPVGRICSAITPGHS